MPPGDASPSSTELVPGFRLERQLGDGVWEAVQTDLGRRVALRRLEPGTAFSTAQWPERPGVVGLFAVVETAGGTYVATRFVPGARTLAQLGNGRAGRRRRWLDTVAATLDGVVHGDLTEHDVLVDADGRALVTGFGRAPDGATAADDRAVLAGMRPPQRRRGLVGAAVGGVAVVVAAMVLATGGDDDAPRSDPVAAGPPPVTAGATDFGSGLSPGQYVTLDCDGAAPSGNSVSCTVMQAALPGRPLVAPRRSLVRAWAVRGATGRVGLQVLRATDAGFIAYNRGRSVTIDDPDAVTVVPADMSVPKGARFALELAPGSGVGVRRGVHAARTERFFGPVRLAPAKAAAAVDGEELLLRVDLVPRPAGAR